MDLITTVFLLISIGNILGESPCGNWISYRDEKCYKVIDMLSVQAEAGSICAKESGSPGIINSEEEQGLVYNYMKNKSIEDNVWIGIKMKDKAFKNVDGSILKYTNWNAGRPTNQAGFDCVEINCDYQGKWVDVKCGKKNAVLCEKMQAWSNLKIENVLLENTLITINYKNND